MNGTRDRPRTIRARSWLVIQILGCLVALRAPTWSGPDSPFDPGPTAPDVTWVVSPRTRQVVPEVLKYGVVSFTEAVLHNHSGLSQDSFRIDGAIFANDGLFVGADFTIRNTIVSGGLVSIDRGATVEQAVFANAVHNDGALLGPVKLLAAVSDVLPGARRWDLIDAIGNKHRWYGEASTPGTYAGSGSTVEVPTASAVHDGDPFTDSIFTTGGAPIDDPDLGVVHYLAPPALDYAGMRTEADRNDDTYFISQAQALSYLISHKVDETIDGKDVTTIRIGTPDAPEFLYIDDDFKVQLVRDGGDDIHSGKIEADAFHVEGGLYVSGDFEVEPTSAPADSYPTDYPALRINALPYCYPALITYPQPCGIRCRFDQDWQAGDTPAMTGNLSRVTLGGSFGGPVELASFNGLVYSQGETHLHAVQGPWIRVQGAILAQKVHVCDWFQLRHDPAVACTMFLEPPSINQVTGSRLAPNLGR